MAKQNRNIQKLNGRIVMTEKLRKTFKTPAKEMFLDTIIASELVQTEPISKKRKIRRKKEIPITRNKIAAMLNQGLSFENITNALSVSKQTVNEVKKQLDLEDLIEADADELVKKFPHALSKNVIQDYENKLARDLKEGMDIIQKYMLDPDKLQGASVKDLAISFNILAQNLRLSTGKSTENIEVKDSKYDRLLASFSEEEILEVDAEILDAELKDSEKDD